MDHQKLIALVQENSLLWDRNNEKFRDKNWKASVWNNIGKVLNSNGPSCRDTFKAIREKYIRERDKLTQFGDKYKKWTLLDSLKFLEPHITVRKVGPERHTMLPTVKMEIPDLDRSYGEADYSKNSQVYLTNEFYKELMKLVCKSEPLWDRQCKEYHNKPLKMQLWGIIGGKLKVDPTVCMLRWKALREKYIRQKQKFNGGEGKWELLDDMSFLDNVIQYRRKHWQIEESTQMFKMNEQTHSEGHSEMIDENDCSLQTNSCTSSEYIESHSDINVLDNFNFKPDSTVESRKRSMSESSEFSFNKREKTDNSQKKSPEQIFGEFVAAILSSKSEEEKNVAMMQIMAILTKPRS